MPDPKSQAEVISDNGATVSQAITPCHDLIVDVTGRQVISTEIGWLGAGHHRLGSSELVRWRPGCTSCA